MSLQSDFRAHSSTPLAGRPECLTATSVKTGHLAASCVKLAAHAENPGRLKPRPQGAITTRRRAMDLRKLKKLIDLVQESGIGEIEITEGEEKVRISRQGAGGPPIMMAAPGMQPMAMMPQA